MCFLKTNSYSIGRLRETEYLLQLIIVKLEVFYSLVSDLHCSKRQFSFDHKMLLLTFY